MTRPRDPCRADEDRSRAIDLLPAPYGEVIRLLDRCTAPADIATRLGLDPDTAPSLVAVAERKLREVFPVLAESDDGSLHAGPCSPSVS